MLRALAKGLPPQKKKQVVSLYGVQGLGGLFESTRLKVWSLTFRALGSTYDGFRVRVFRAQGGDVGR